VIDSKLMVVTKVQDLKVEDVVALHKALSDIEQGFRVLKS
jgi:hypothetical protein